MKDALPKARKNTLYCFSPAVMIITAVIELALAAIAYWKYRKTKVGVLVTFTLLFLGLFQAAEYQICEGLLSRNLLWTKLGLVSITLLPPLGLHLAETIIGTQRFSWIGYLVAFVYICLFLFVPGIVHGGTCEGNYVIVHTQYIWYGIYYFAFLTLGLIEAGRALHANTISEKKHKEALIWLVIGYLSFTIPAAIALLMDPTLRAGMPSVLCGFAIILALILAGRVLPIYHGEE